MLTQWPMTHQWATKSVEQTQALTAQLVPSIGAIVPVMTSGESAKCPSEKRTRSHLTLDTLGMDSY